MVKFTDKFISNLKPRATNFDVRETDGFVLRVQPSGTKSFYHVYKIAGKLYRIFLGPYPALSLAEARTKNRELLIRRQHGENPAVVLEKKIDSTPSTPVLTVAGLCQEYIKLYAVKRKRRWQDDERILTKEVVAVIGGAAVETVTRRQVIELLNRIVERGSPATANQVLKLWRRAWNFAIEQALVETSPLHMVKAPALTTAKSRNLSREEIRLFWAVLDADTHKTGPAMRRLLKFILVTGQRPGECNGINRSEIDGKWWTIPAARHKANKPHRVYLSPLARKLLGTEQQPFGFDQRAVARVVRRLITPRGAKGDKAAILPLPPFTPHDLRRTCATQFGARGYSNEQIGRFLGHEVGGITGIYNRHTYDRLLREMALSWRPNRI